MADEIGKRYCRLTVVRLAAKGSHGRHTQWLCQCDCGNETVVRLNSLHNGDTKSCGCLGKLKAMRRLRMPYGLKNAWKYSDDGEAA